MFIEKRAYYAMWHEEGMTRENLFRNTYVHIRVIVNLDVNHCQDDYWGIFPFDPNPPRVETIKSLHIQPQHKFA